MPRPPPPGVSPDTICRALGSIYGTKDAGRGFWLYLKINFEEQGFTHSKLENALFFFHNSSGRLTAIAGTHVDDVLLGYDPDCPEVVLAIKTLREKIEMTEELPPFRCCGRDFTRLRDGHGIKIDMKSTVMALGEIVISKVRRSTPSERLVPEEITELRSTLGSLGWIARQLRADICVDVSLKAQRVGIATVQDLVETNRIVVKCVADPDFALVFHAFPTMMAFSAADSSFGNVDSEYGEKTKSQAGYIIGLSELGFAGGVDSRIHVIEWQSASIKRVVRATLAAEGYGVTEGAEALDWLRNVIQEMTHPNMSLSEVADAYRIPALWLSDSKSLVDVVQKDAGQPSDKRLRIVIANLKQMLLEAGTTFAWIDTLVMLADGLTKLDADTTILIRALCSGMYCIQATEEALEQKERTRASRQRAKAVRDTAKEAATGSR